ncbi:MAG: WD40 repeat domain-containing protein [Candidatus Acidiferrales bacterium]
MTRALDVVIALCCCCCAGSVHAADVKQVASFSLPCESSDQIISQTGKSVAVLCRDRSVHVIDVATGRAVFAETDSPRLTAADFSRDGKWLGLGFWDGTLKVVPLSGGAAREWKAGDHRVHSIQFLLDGHSAFVDSLGEPAQIWDFGGTPKVVATLHSDFSGPSAVGLSPDGSLLATAGGDTVIRLYDTSTWKTLHENRSATKLEMFDLDFTPDGKAFLTGGADDHVIVIDAATGEETHKLGGRPGVIGDVSVLGDGTHAAVAYEDVDDLHKPPDWAMWNLQTQKAETMRGMDKYTAHRIVNGKLWLAATNGTTLQIFEYN